MLSEEEKKAIERIDTIQDLIIEYGQYNADIEDVEYFSKILNLIEKQQQELDKEKEKNKELEKTILEFVNDREKILKTPVISKDKLKEKIKEKKEYAERYIDGVDIEEGQAMYKILEELEQELLED